MDDQTVERTDLPASQDSPPSEKKNGRTSLLESGEDFEVLEDDDSGDDLPPLEDTGGGKSREQDQSEKQKADEVMGSSRPVDEWLYILGMKPVNSRFITLPCIVFLNSSCIYLCNQVLTT